MMIVVWSVSYIYALFHLVLGLVQLKGKNIPTTNSIFIITGSISVLLTSLFLGHTFTWITLVTVGFFLIQIGAVRNEFLLQGRITLSHQMVRFALFLIILSIYSIFN